MNMRFLMAGLALGLLALGGCAEAGPKVVTGFDPSARFSAFGTFAFSGITDRGHEVGASDHSPLRGRIKEMVARQCAARGLRQVSLEERPDLLVHLFFGVKDIESVQGTPSSYSYRTTTYAYHEGDWVPVPPRSSLTTREDHEGTLIVDLAESSKQKLVWRAVIRAILGDNLEKNFELADKGIAEAFTDYPPATGK